MRAGLSFNAGFTTKCIAAGLGLLCLSHFTARAQSVCKGFSVAVSGGYSKAYNKANNFPFTEAGSGYFIQAAGMLPLGPNWGGMINTERSSLSLLTAKAPATFLYNDPNAVAITIQADRFNITNAGLGIYYDLAIAENFLVRLAPVIGYSYLQTPRVNIFVETEPNTTYVYEKGGSGAIFYALNIRPALRINKQASIHLNIGYSYAAYHIPSNFNGAAVNNKVNYGKLNLGAGFEYSFTGGSGR